MVSFVDHEQSININEPPALNSTTNSENNDQDRAGMTQMDLHVQMQAATFQGLCDLNKQTK